MEVPGTRRVGFVGRLLSRYGLRKSPDEIIAEARDPARGLKKSLGALDLVALGIGAIIGTGIFVLAGVGATHAGPAIIFSFVVAGFACALAGLCYAELASTIPTSGSAYGYTYSALGEAMAWVLGWALVLEYAVGAITVSIGWSAYLQGLLRGTPLQIPAVFGSSPLDGAGGLINVPAIVVVLAITAILVRGTKESARTTSALVAVKLVVILLVIGVGVFFVNPANFSPLAPMGISGVFAGAALIFFAYIGFDAVSTTAEETKNPRRDLPIGILGSLAICTILYILAATVLIGMVPYTTFGSVAEATQAPFEYAFRSNGLVFVGKVIAVGAIAGITSVLMVLLLGGPRIFFALARDGLLPRSIAQVHPKFGTPARATLATGLIVAAVAGFMPLMNAAAITNIGTLFAFTLVCVSALALRLQRPDLERPFQVPLWWITAPAGALACLYLIYSLGGFTILFFLAWAGLGLMVYALYGMRNSRLFLRQSQGTRTLVPEGPRPGPAYEEGETAVRDSK